MIGDRLQHTRLAAGLTLDELRILLRDQGCSLTRAALSKYEHDKSIPPAGTLLKLARVLKVPATHFLHDPNTAVTWLAFRKHPCLPAARQQHIKAYARQVAENQIWLEAALNLNIPATLPRPRLVGTPDEAENAARDLRDTWKLGEAPIESVTQTAETHGAVVISWSHDEGDLDGLSAWVNDATPLAVVNDQTAPDRRRFTLAHEFGHMLMTTKGDDTGAVEEQLAHRFAAAFLVPGVVAIQELGKHRRHLSLDEIALLKQKYGLSMLGWIHRARDLEIIDPGLHNTLCRTFVARGWKKVEPVAYHGDEAPTRLEQLTARALAEGIIGAARARQICPRAANKTLLLEQVPDEHLHDPRSLLDLPRAERERLLAGAAARADVLYREDPNLTGFDAFGAEDLLDYSDER
jgi:Zn-dependent peptidase ImmA (M78 family)/transcriptional regulator with XRE-family HTH domain